MDSHEHKVEESKARSLLKAILGRILEITVGTLVFGTIITIFFPGVQNPYLAGLSLNLIEEGLCFLITYGTERIWNKINWGRKVIEIANNGSRKKEDSSKT